MILTPEFSRVAGATWSRVQAIIRGLDDDVKSFGIMTAWNPNNNSDHKLNRRINQEANTRLIRELQDESRHPVFGAIKILGTFPDLPEGSFLIPNVSRAYMIGLCRKFKQWAVVYAEKFSDPNDEKVRVRYELLGPRGQARSQPKTVVFTSGDKIGEHYLDDLLRNFSSMGSNRPKEVKPGETAPVMKRFKIDFDE